jgi:glycogen(starch) synthase
MRIAYVITQFPPQVRSGLGRCAEQVTPYLAREHELTVHTLNVGRQPVSERRDGLVIHRPLGRLLGAALRRRGLEPARPTGLLLLAVHVVVSNLRYARTLRRDPPDLVVLHDATNFLCGTACRYLLRLPVVPHIHTTEHRTAARRRVLPALGVLAGVERWLGRTARRVVVAADEMREHLTAAGWDRERIDAVCLGGTFERVRDRRDDRPGAAGGAGRAGRAAGPRVPELGPRRGGDHGGLPRGPERRHRT